MLTINSISGGKSSAYMALHNPADVNIFAAVLSRDPACIISDPSLRRYAGEKIPAFDWNAGGCRELDLTLLNLRKLEQAMGREITWVAAPFTFEDVVTGDIEPAIAKGFASRKTLSAMLPNSRARFCTQAMKLYPIFWHCYLTGDGDPVVMNIGFRWDEKKRVEMWECKNDQLKVPLMCDIVGKYRGKHRRDLLEWRIPTFPLYRAGVDKADVARFWAAKGWEWPIVSNCDFCFFHRTAEQQHQALHYPDRAAWWIKMEEMAGATWGDRPLVDILDDGQLDLFGDDLDQFSCACTD